MKGHCKYPRRDGAVSGGSIQAAFYWHVLLCIFLLFSPHVLSLCADEYSGESKSPEQLDGFALGDEMVLLEREGSFEVSGSSASFAVAWTERGAKGDYRLNITLFEDNQNSFSRLLSNRVDGRERIFLKKSQQGIAVCWKEDEGWCFAFMKRSLNPSPMRQEIPGYETTFFKLDEKADPITLAMKENQVAFLVVPRQDYENVKPETYFERSSHSSITGKKELIEVFNTIDFPEFHQPTLFAYDIESFELQMLSTFPGEIKSACMSHRNGEWTIAYLESATRIVSYGAVDSSGNLSILQMLSDFPATSISSLLKEVVETSIIGWIETRAHEDQAILGMVRRDASGASISTKELSSSRSDASAVSISEGEGIWAAWNEVGDKGEELRIVSLDMNGEVLCLSALVNEQDVEKVWILEESKESFLLQQKACLDGKRSLSIRPLACKASEPRSSNIIKEKYAMKQGDQGISFATPSTSMPPSMQYPVIQGADPCDGYDNDMDGEVDEGCDRYCDNPQKWGPDVRLTDHPSGAFHPSMVWTGNGYSVSWHDFRDGSWEIYFGQLDSSGNKIGSDRRVTFDAADSDEPAIVWTHSEYGIVWCDLRDGNKEVYFARLDGEGNKLGTDVRVTYDPSLSSKPSLVWTGIEYGIIWHDARNANDEIYFVRLDPSGNKIGSDVRVTHDQASSLSPSIVFTGSCYGVSWQDGHGNDQNNEIYFARLDLSGTMIGSPSRVSRAAKSSNNPSLAWSGSEYAISWHDQRNGNDEIYCARLDIYGNKIGPDIRVTFDPERSQNASIVWTGNEYGVAWYDYREAKRGIYFTRISASGEKIGSDVFTTYDSFHDISSAFKPSLVWTGNDYGIAWHDRRLWNSEIYFTRIRCCDDMDADGFSECAGDTNDQDPSVNPDMQEVCDGKDNDSDGSVDEGCACNNPEKWAPDNRITNDAARSSYTSLRWTGTEYGAAWHDNRDGNDEIYFARIDTSGSKIGSDVRVTEDYASSNYPSLAWTGSEYGIAWQDTASGNQEIHFARLDPAGNKIGSDARVTYDSGSSESPCLVWSGNDYGLSWHDSRDGNEEIYFVKLNTAGNKLSNDVRVTFESNASNNPSLVWNGEQYALSWYDYRDGNAEIYFARIDSYGNKLDGDIRITDDPYNSYHPSLAWTGSEYGIAWHEYRNGNPEIYFARMDNNGVKLGNDTRVTYHSSSSFNPVLLWNGTHYGLSWWDTRTGYYGIYFVRLDTFGNIAGPQGEIRLSTISSNAYYPSFIWNGNAFAFSWHDYRDRNSEIYFAQVECCKSEMDADNDGWCWSDCNNEDSSIYPWAPELCQDLKDNDCDGIEENKDVDGDGYHDAACVGGNDCDDENGDIHPGAVEIYCNGIDEDCNGLANDAPDLDGDQYDICDTDDIHNPDGNIADCNDKDAAIFPGALEICNACDNDCDGLIDEGCDLICDNPEKLASDMRITWIDDYSEDPSLVWNGNGYALVWKEYGYTWNCEVAFARLDSAGNKIGGDIRITYTTPDSHIPSLIWTGKEYGVTWYENTEKVYFARIDSEGNKIGSDLLIGNASSGVSLIWTGSEYGLAWPDDTLYPYDPEIYFARVNPSGEKIGSNIRITFENNSSREPSLVWNGNGYGVSWTDDRDGNDEIYFALLDPSGNKIGSDVRISNDSSYSYRSSLAWSGSDYAVSWDDNRSGNYEIYFARIDSTGEKIGSDVRLTNAPYTSGNGRLIWNGIEYALTWTDYRDSSLGEIYFMRLDSSGNKNTSDIRVTRSYDSSTSPSLVWTGNAYSIAWDERFDSMANIDIFLAKLDCCFDDLDPDLDGWCWSDCNTSDSSVYPGALELCTDAKDNDCDGTIDNKDQDGDKHIDAECFGGDDCDDGDPGIFSGAGEILCNGIDESCSGLAFDTPDSDGDGYDRCDSSDIVNPDNRPRDCNDLNSGSNIEATEACNGFDDDCDGERDEGCIAVCDDPQKQWLDTRITFNDRSSYFVSMVWTGNEAAIAWQDERDSYEPEIYFARIDSSGNKIGSERRITYADEYSERPSLVWNGRDYAIAWMDDRDSAYSRYSEIYFARLNAGGNKIGSDVRVTFDDRESSKPSLVWTGSEYGIAWYGEQDDSDGEIYFARLDSEGNKIGDNVRVTWDTQDSLYPSLLWNGSEYAIVWEDYRTINSELYFARLDSSGNKIGSDTRITWDSGISKYPSLVWTGDEYGVAWEDNRDRVDSYDWEVYFARLDSSGNKIGDDVRVTYGYNYSSDPVIAWTGNEYGIVWSDFRNQPNSEVYFARLTSLGNKIGYDMRVTWNNEYSDGPALIWTGDKYILSWSDTRNNYTSEIYTGRIECCGLSADADRDGWCSHDCNDEDPSIHPGAQEICNDGVDNDCDGSIDNKDSDRDGFIDEACAAGNDCDDENPLINPVSFEILCNGIYESCNGMRGDAPDVDQDGYDACGSDDIVNPDGREIDCNDFVPLFNPDSEETCNGFDDDCDSSLDEGCGTSCENEEKWPPDMRITWNTEGSINSSLIWTGSRYGISWQDRREGNSEIFFVQLDSSGNTIGTETRITWDSFSSDNPSLVWTGREYSIAWQDERNYDSEIYFVRLDSDGNKIASDIRVTFDSWSSDNPALVWTGRGYGIAWEDCRDSTTVYPEIYFALLDPSGQKISSDMRITISGESRYPSLVWTGDEFGLSWIDGSASQDRIFFARLDSSGNKIGNDIQISPSGTLQTSMIWNGYEYGICWADFRDSNREIYFTRLDSEGNKIGSETRVTNNYKVSSSPSLVWTGSEYGISWNDDRDNNYEIYFTRLDSSGGKISTDLRVTYHSSISYRPSIVWTGKGYSISWDDTRDTNYEIYFSGIGCCIDIYDGDNDGYCWADCDNGNDAIYPGAPEVCNGSDDDCDGSVDNKDYDGDKHIDDGCTGGDDCDDDDPFAYQGASEILCNGVDENCNGLQDEAPDYDGDGYDACGHSDSVNPDNLEKDCNNFNATVVPGATEICNGFDDDCDGILDNDCDTICDKPEKMDSDIRVTQDYNQSSNVSFIWTGNEYGIVWEDGRSYAYDPEIYFARLDSSGNKVGSDVRVTWYSRGSRNPSIAWTGSEYGVIWEDDRDSYNDYVPEIYFARLDSSGNKITSDIRITFNSQESYGSSLVWTGSEYGIAWADRRDGSSGSEIYVARLDNTGKKIGEDIRVTFDANQSFSPSLVWTGNEYGISWVDRRTNNNEIFFVRLDVWGSKIEADTRITFDQMDSSSPHMQWTGSEYGLVWSDNRDGNFEIYFTHLDANGLKIGYDRRVTHYSQDSKDPKLTWSGSEYGVGWTDGRNADERVYFARLDSSGNKTSSDMDVTSYSGPSHVPSLIWMGTGYRFAWHDGRSGNYEIYFTAIGCCTDFYDADHDGWCWKDCNDNDNAVYPGAQELCNGIDDDCDGILDNRDSDGDTHIDIECPGGDDCDDGNPLAFVGAGEILCNGIDEDCDGLGDDTRADSDGDGFDACGFDDALNPDGLDKDCNDFDSSIHPARAEICNGYDDNCDGTVDEGCDAICDDGDKHNPDVRITKYPGSSYSPSLVWTGSEYGVSWHDYRDGGSPETYFARFDSMGDKLNSDIRITYNPGESHSSSLVWTGSCYGISWSDDRDGNLEIYFARLDPSGNKIGSDVRISYTSKRSLYPSLVWTGEEFAIVWQDERSYDFDLHFAKLDAWGNTIGSPKVFIQNLFNATVPALIWNGEGFGVAWQDDRDGNYEIYFAQLDRAGNMKGTDTRITYDSSHSLFPFILWTGKEYGVCWTDARDKNNEIYFARLDSFGSKIGADFRITYNSNDSYSPSLFFTGNQYVVTWRDSRDQNTEIYFAQFNAEENIIGADVRITQNSSESYLPSIVWTGSMYGICWYDNRDGNFEIYFAQVNCCEDDRDLDGYGACEECNDTNSAINPSAVEICDAKDNNCDGTVDNKDADNDGYRDIECLEGNDCDDDDALMYPGAPELCNGKDDDCDGILDNKDSDEDGYIDAACPGGNDCNDADPYIKPGGVEIVCNAIDENCNGLQDDSVDHDADGYDSCGYNDANNPDNLQRDCNDASPFMHPDAQETCSGLDDDCDGSIDEGCDSSCDSPEKYGSEIRVTFEPHSSLSNRLVWTGNEYGVAWRDDRSGDSDIYFARLDDSGNKIGEDVRLTGGSSQYSPSLIWTGREYGVSWYDYRDGNYEIYLVRLDASGSKIGENVRVTYDSSSSVYPTLTWTGNEYGICWRDNRDGNYEIYFARMDSSGDKILTDRRITYDASDSLKPILIWTGNEYALSWYDGRDGNREVYFTRLDSAGDKIGTDIRVTYDSGYSTNPFIAWTGNGYGVSWEDDRTGNYEIYFARLNSSGNKIGSDVRMTTTYQSSNSPSLIWTGSEYGLSWSDYSVWNYEIYFVRLNASGSKIGEDLRLTYASGSSGSPSLAWTGTRYGIAWNDDRHEQYKAEIYFAHIRCCDDVDNDNYSECSDCDDNDPLIHPSASERCNDIDDNCDGTLDNKDSDEDGFVDGQCQGGDDCDDDDANVYPGAPAICDGKNNNCSDPNWPALSAEENDDDGDGFAECEGDCNDADTEAAPGLVEICDGKDNDCDGTIDNAGTEIICNGIDDDCDGTDGTPDHDMDGYDACGSSDANNPDDLERDCNDSNPWIHPDAQEGCNGYDDNCNSIIDEGCETGEICETMEKIGADYRVTSNILESHNPSIVWTGNEYGISWNDNRVGNHEIYFGRLDPAGNKIGGDVRITDNLYYSTSSALAWTGSEYGIAWHDFREGNYEIYFTRVDSSGNKIGSDIRVTNAINDSWYPSIVWSGSEYGIAWHDNRDGNDEIYFVRLDSSGSAIGADIRVTNEVNISSYPSLAWTGSGYGMTWHDYRDGNHEIYFARLNLSGTKIGADVRVTSDPSSSSYPVILWTGSEYGIAWEDYRDGNGEIYFAEIDATGSKIGSDVRITYASSSSASVTLAWTGSVYAISWVDYRDGNDEVYFVQLDSLKNKIGSDLRVTKAQSNSYAPSMVWSGSEYGIAWYDYRDGNSEIYFARVKCCHDEDEDGITGCSGDCNDDDASIHPGASEFCDGIDNNCDAVIDNKDSDVDGYIDSNCLGGNDCNDSDPAIHPNAPEIICNAVDENCVSTDDAPDRDADGYDACGSTDPNNPDNLPRDCNDSNASIHPDAPEICNGLDDDCDGTIDEDCETGGTCPVPAPEGSDVRITSAGGSYYPSITWTGNEYGVAWHDDRDGNNEIYFGRLDASGNKIGSDTRVTYDSASSDSLSLVWTGNEYGVSWNDDRSGNYEIYFARLTSSGNKIGSDVRITQDDADSWYPSLVWTGSQYGISWNDSRDGNMEIYFIRLDSSGNKIGSDVRVTSDADYSDVPSLVWTGSEFGIAWEDYRSGNWDIYFARLDASGNKIGSDTRVTDDAGDSWYPSLAWMGSEFGIAWEDYRHGNGEIYFARLDASGNKIGTDARITENDSYSDSCSLVWIGGEYGVSWDDYRDDDWEIYFARIDASGNKVGSDVRVTNASGESWYPSMIWTGTEYGVCWLEYRNGNAEIYMNRIQCSQEAGTQGE